MELALSDGDGDTTYAGDYVNTSESGGYVVVFWANDSTGKTSTSMITFWIRAYTDTPPVIRYQMASPDPGNMTDTINISARVTDDIGVDSVRANITRPDSTEDVVSMSDPDNDSVYTVSYANTTLNGSYAIRIQANDTVSHNDTTLVLLWVQPQTPSDNPPRVHNVTASPDPAEVNDTITVSAEATDDAGVDSVRATIQRPDSTIYLATLSDADNDSIYTVDYSQTSLNGSYTVTVQANDTLGQTSSSVITFVVLAFVDDPQVISSPSAVPNPVGVNGTVTVSANVTDDVVVDAVLANITTPSGNTSSLTLTDPDNDTIYSSTFSDTSQNGSYTVTFWANDSGGLSDSAQISFWAQYSIMVDIALSVGWNLISLPIAI